MIYPDNPPEKTLHANAWELYDALRDLLPLAEDEISDRLKLARDEREEMSAFHDLERLHRAHEAIRRAADIELLNDRLYT
jgi:hypothetical protein